MIVCRDGRCTVSGPINLSNVVALLAEGKDSTFANRLHEATKPVADGTGKAADKGAGREASPVEATPPDTAERRDGPLARGLRRLFGRS